MKSFFAPPERASDKDLKKGIEAVGDNPVFTSLMSLSNGAFAILNMQRQLLALNKNYLEAIGIENPEMALGLRPGEAIRCVHATDNEGGCGTSKHCATCGAAIAIVSAQELQHPVEQKCCLEMKFNGSSADRFFSVRAQKHEVDGEKFILLYLQDITRQQNFAAMEKLFLHDMGNIVGGLVGASELMEPGAADAEDLMADVKILSLRLANEINLQRALLQSDFSSFAPQYSDVLPSEILKNMETLFANHPVAKGKMLSIWHCGCDDAIETDYNLLLRIVENMVKNAMEATTEGQEVRLRYQCGDDAASFEVWNREFIPEKKALRIFQRNYSSKEGLGHGLGTFCMKLFGEQVLGGSVDFNTSESEGTTFRIVLAKR